MSIAPSFTSTSLPNPFTTPPCRSLGYTSLPSLSLQLSTSSRRYRSLVTCLSSGLSDGEPAKNIDTNKETSNPPPIQPAAPSPPLPKAPNWMKWTLGSIVWLAVPSWKKIQGGQDLLSKVDNTVEVIEAVAEVTEKLASDVAEELPDGSGMKKLMLGLEHASEEVLKDAKAVDSFVDKVEEVEAMLKMGRKIVDQVKPEEKNKTK